MGDAGEGAASGSQLSALRPIGHTDGQGLSLSLLVGVDECFM